MDFNIVGSPCKILTDHVLALNCDKGKDLILWRDDTRLQLWVDKFDVRMLLDDAKEFDMPRDGISSELNEPEEGETSSVLNEERFAELLAGVMFSVEKENCDMALQDQDLDHKQTTVHWDYVDSSSTGKPFVKPEWLHLPMDVTVLPKTQVQYNVILHTVKRLITAGQLEVLLRLKMSDQNSKMSFLNVGDELHPFYRYIRSLDEAALWSLLLNKPPEPVEMNTAASTYDFSTDAGSTTVSDNFAAAATTNATDLSTLIGGYCSDSDSDADAVSPSTEEKVSICVQEDDDSLVVPEDRTDAASLVPSDTNNPIDPNDSQPAEITVNACVDADKMLQFDCDLGVKFYAPAPANTSDEHTANSKAVVVDAVSANSSVGSAADTVMVSRQEGRLHRAKLMSGRFLMLSGDGLGLSEVNAGIEGLHDGDSSIAAAQSGGTCACVSENILCKRSRNESSSNEEFNHKRGCSPNLSIGSVSEASPTLTTKITLALHKLYGLD